MGSGGNKWSISRHGRCSPGERAPGIHWIRNQWRTEKPLQIPGIEPRFSRSQSSLRNECAPDLHQNADS
jgi:hypothetical protein